MEESISKSSGANATKTLPIPSASKFLSGFSCYIRVDVAGPQHEFAEDPHPLLTWLRSSMASLCEELSVNYPQLHFTLWQSLFVVCEADAQVSVQAEQDRGTFLVGIGEIQSNGTTWQEELIARVESFEDEISEQGIITDLEEAGENVSLAARFVEQDHLGPLVEDDWIWPQKSSITPLTFNTQHAPKIDDFVLDQIRMRGPGNPGSFLHPGDKFISGIRTDARFSQIPFAVVYRDGILGPQELDLESWGTKDSTEEGFIPRHRLMAVKRKDRLEIVWHRELRMDKFWGTGRIGEGSRR